MQDRVQQRAPQWTGGGVVFAPVPRDYSFKMNKKERRIALKSALTTSTGKQTGSPGRTEIRRY